MAKINSILSERLKQQDHQPKMTNLAQKSSSGALTTFSGMFALSELTLDEKSELSELLQKYAHETSEIETDLKYLSSLTMEVKAINNQAALLHGERIQKAQTILKNYQDGAFTAWLLNVYGNRQTPYNFLQYYEFFIAVSKELHPIIENMPRQIVYKLASREGSIEKKEVLVKESKGKTKQEILEQIKKTFPLKEEDRRSSSSYITLLNILQKALPIVSSLKLDKSQKEAVLSLLSNLHARVK